MAKNKHDNVDMSLSFDEQDEKVREEVLGDEEVGTSDPGQNNYELDRADRHVNEEKTSPAEHRNRRHHAIAQGNRTLVGTPSDVHQVLVALSNMHRDDAAAHDEVKALLEKYEAEHALDELNPEVVAHIRAYKAELSHRAALYRKTRTLLEEHV